MENQEPEPESGQKPAVRSRPVPGPKPTSVSLRSDSSKDWLIDFKDGQMEPLKDLRKMENPGPESGRRPAIGPRPVPGPKPTCVSLRSDSSKDWNVDFKTGHVPLKDVSKAENSGHGSGSGPSHTTSRPDCESVSSDWCKDHPHNFKEDPSQRNEDPGGPVGEESQNQLGAIFKNLEDEILTFVKEQLKMLHKVLFSDYPECLGNDEDEEQSSREAFLKITLYFLRKMKQDLLAERLLSKTPEAVCGSKLKTRLQQKFRCVSEGTTATGKSALLNQIYTELYITEGGNAGVNQEHEVRHIETCSRKPAAVETIITCEDIFKDTEKQVRTVLTKGVAGVGKTMLTQKFSLDWAEGRANQDIHLLLPFTFRELNVLRDTPFSLVELLHHFFSESAILRSFDHLQVLFIFDGLDECRLPLDFTQTPVQTDITESVSVDVLLINLIRGDLLPSSRLWITTRPAAASQIPVECISMMTEVRGFTDPQKEQYFRKRFKRKKAKEIISHIRASRSLYIMCHIPVFCWILSTVLRHLMKTEATDQLPQTLTQMYVHFLVVQAKIKSFKYDGRSKTDSPWTPETRQMVESLGKLAFEQLQKGNLIFYESDLSECGLDAAVVSVYSGVFTQVFREEQGLYQDKVFCFIHLSVQEFLAALYAHLTFFSSGVNLLSPPQTCGSLETEMSQQTFENTGPTTTNTPHQPSLTSNINFKMFKMPKTRANSESTAQTSDSPEADSETQCEFDPDAAFYCSAVDLALQSPNGHLDLFLRFLLGLSLPTNQNLLPGLLTQTGRSSGTNQKTADYIKMKLDEDLSAEQSMNLLHCLNELNDRELVETIQWNLREGHLAQYSLSPALFSALLFIVLSSDSDLEEFDLKKYYPSEEALLKLMPLVKISSRAILSWCNLSQSSCGPLSSVLSSSSLTHLDLSKNDLQDSGVELLCSGLKSSTCRLETLSLSWCNLSQSSCGPLSSVLSSSSLTHLDLSHNNLQDSGVELLCSGLKSAPCRLETLSLSWCNLSQSSCDHLSSVLSSSSLTHLDLSNNEIQDSGVELLCSGLISTPCRLKTLSLSSCNLSQSSCGSLTSVLSSSSLTHLDLSHNNLQASGVELLCSGLKSAPCRLETLSLSSCNLSQSSCGPLSSVLSSSNLTHLDLSKNNLQDSGVELLCSELKSAPCKLETLSLSGCNLSQRSCGFLSSLLTSSSLTHLNLSNNNIQDSGVELLCLELESTPCRLETLSLSWCNLSQSSCGPLSSVLSSSSLTHLDLSNNNLQDSGAELLCSGLESSTCRLESLRLSGCLVSERGGVSLASALYSASSHLNGALSCLRELDLSYNHPGPSAEPLTVLKEDPHCPLDSLRLDPAGEQWMVPGLRKYYCELSLDPNTAHWSLQLSEDKRTVTCETKEHKYPDHQDRFTNWAQVLCSSGLTGLCYWEVDWSGKEVSIAVSYRGIRRNGGEECEFGGNDHSWSLGIFKGQCSARHNNRETLVYAYSSGGRMLSGRGGVSSGRVGVFLDSVAGCLSFYEILSCGQLSHLYTFISTFTEPLFPGFGHGLSSTVSLVDVSKESLGDSFVTYM